MKRAFPSGSCQDLPNPDFPMGLQFFLSLPYFLWPLLVPQVTHTTHLRPLRLSQPKYHSLDRRRAWLALLSTCRAIRAHLAPLFHSLDPSTYLPLLEGYYLQGSLFVKVKGAQLSAHSRTKTIYGQWTLAKEDHRNSFSILLVPSPGLLLEDSSSVWLTRLPGPLAFSCRLDYRRFPKHRGPPKVRGCQKLTREHFLNLLYYPSMDDCYSPPLTCYACPAPLGPPSSLADPPHSPKDPTPEDPPSPFDPPSPTRPPSPVGPSSPSANLPSPIGRPSPKDSPGRSASSSPQRGEVHPVPSPPRFSIIPRYDYEHTPINLPSPIYHPKDLPSPRDPPSPINPPSPRDPPSLTDPPSPTDPDIVP